jgi:hypothetical protein
VSGATTEDVLDENAQSFGQIEHTAHLWGPVQLNRETGCSGPLAWFAARLDENDAKGQHRITSLSRQARFTLWIVGARAEPAGEVYSDGRQHHPAAVQRQHLIAQDGGDERPARGSLLSRRSPLLPLRAGGVRSTCLVPMPIVERWKVPALRTSTLTHF